MKRTKNHQNPLLRTEIGVLRNELEPRPNDSRARPNHCGARLDHSGLRSDHSGARPGNSGGRPIDPGGRPGDSGGHSHGSGALRNRSAEIPEKPSALRFGAFRRLLSSPAVNVVVLAATTVAVFVGSRIITRPESNAQIRFFEQAGKVGPEVEPGQRPASGHQIFGGEVYDTAVRLRETAALGMAISLAIFKEAAKKGSVPANVKQLWPAITTHHLLPPGLELEGDRLSSPSSVFSVRYQPKPFQFEVVSLPNQDTDGPALMFRFPLPMTDAKAIPYFRSSMARRNQVPRPFVSAEQLSQIGWTMEAWRAELLPRDERILKLLNEESGAWSGEQ